MGHGLVCDGPHAGINEALERVHLVDHHVHSIIPGRLDAQTFMSLLTESDRPAAIAAAGWDSQLGYAIRRWCAPILGLDQGVAPATYLEHRLGLTNEAAAGQTKDQSWLSLALTLRHRHSCLRAIHRRECGLRIARRA